MNKRNYFHLGLMMTILAVNLLLPFNGLAQGLEPDSPSEPAATGDRDGTFAGFGGDGIVDISGMAAHAFALQPDGKIVVVGNHSGSLVVQRFNQNGVLDNTFGTGGEFRIATGGSSACNDEYSCGIAVQADGKIVAVGDSELGGDEDFLHRLP